MEADWSAEIGAELPTIHVPWVGFVDLRGDGGAVHAIAETADFPSLSRALTMLNGAYSPVFTSKCDLWNLAAEEIDRYEFGALEGDDRCGLSSYIDLLERDGARFASFEFHEGRAKTVVNRLRDMPLSNGRLDLVIRPAIVDGRHGFGLTLYAAGCGGDTASALSSWEAVLAAMVLATIDKAEPSAEGWSSSGNITGPANVTGE